MAFLLSPGNSFPRAISRRRFALDGPLAQVAALDGPPVLMACHPAATVIPLAGAQEAGRDEPGSTDLGKVEDRAQAGRPLLPA